MDFQGPRQVASELQTAVRELATCVRPISTIEEGAGDWRFTGSAFVVSAGPRRIVIAAEHVVCGLAKKFLSISSAGGLPWPTE